MAQKLSPAEALARKIVRYANQPDRLDLTEIYAEACVSREPQGPPVSGLAGLREKNAGWESIVHSQNWTAVNTFVKGNRICIEWHCDLKLQDGRELELEEVALHEVRGGKIVSERYYYDPSVLAAPAEAEAAPAQRMRRPRCCRLRAPTRLPSGLQSSPSRPRPLRIRSSRGHRPWTPGSLTGIWPESRRAEARPRTPPSRLRAAGWRARARAARRRAARLLCCLDLVRAPRAVHGQDQRTRAAAPRCPS